MILLLYIWKKYFIFDTTRLLNHEFLVISGVGSDASFADHTLLEVGKFWAVNLKKGFCFFSFLLGFLLLHLSCKYWTILLKFCVFYWGLHLFKAPILLRHVQCRAWHEQPSSWLSVCWMATRINKRSAPGAVGSHSQPVKELLRAISGFLEGVLKTYNLFGNFIFLHETVQGAMLCTFNYELFWMLKVLSQMIKLEETMKKSSSCSEQYKQ